MSSNLKLNDRYRILFKKYFFRREFYIKPYPHELRINIDKEYKDKRKEKLRVYDFDIVDIANFESLIFTRGNYLQTFNTCIYKVLFKNSEHSLIMEIVDVAVFPKYRNKGIGRQLMSLLDKIALENNIKHIVGEIQEERDGEPIDKTKRFYENNGFKVWHDEKADFSGWVIKKSF